MRLSNLLPYLLLFTTLTAHAEEISTWNFRGPNPVETSTQGLTTVNNVREGLSIKTDSEGYIIWKNRPLVSPFEVLTLQVKSKKATKASIIWTPPGQADEYFQLPFTLPASEMFTNIDVIVDNYVDWNWQTEYIGIRIPAESEFVLREAQMRHWTPMEKMIEGVKSFWTFDKFRIYSINFLWGPLIATNSPARAVLFNTLPPIAWSSTRIFYVILSLAFAAAMYWRFVLRKSGAAALTIVTVTFCGFWLLFDLRMGLEVLSYVRNDFKQYILAPADKKTLRTHQNLYVILDTIMPKIHEHKRFALFTHENSVVYPNLRYMAYPSVGVKKGEAMSGIKLWVIHEQPDIKIDEQQRLTKAGDILSPPGKVTLRIDANTYLFETDK